MENEKNAPRLLSVKETAKSLAISDRTLFSLTQAGRIKSVRLGKACVRYDIRDIEEFIRTAKGAGS